MKDWQASGGERGGPNAAPASGEGISKAEMERMKTAVM